MRFNTLCLAGIVPAALAAAVVPVSGSITASADPATFQLDSLSDSNAVAMAVNMVSAIPDDVLSQGDVATRKWVVSNPVPDAVVIPDVKNRSVLSCFYAITKSIASGDISLDIIKKIKKDIDSLGGVWAVTKLILSNNSNKGGPALKEIKEALKTVKDVVVSCAL